VAVLSAQSAQATLDAASVKKSSGPFVEREELVDANRVH
jgi:hypothetical protein